MTPIRVRIAARDPFRAQKPLGDPFLAKPAEGYVVAFIGELPVLAVVVLDNGKFVHVSLDKLFSLIPMEKTLRDMVAALEEAEEGV